MSAHCPTCGAPCDADARFCGECGQTLQGTAAAKDERTLLELGVEDTLPQGQKADSVAPAPVVPPTAQQPGQPVTPQQGPAASAAPATPDELIGRTLSNRYQVLRKLGAGGFGAVFEGLQIQTGRSVALKVLYPHMTRDASLVARFRREAKTAASLRDAHTVVTFDFDETPEGVLFIAMELVTGRSLHAELKAGGRLDPARALRIVEQMCSSLAEAHAANIVHRDIKPENVMLEERPGAPDYVKVLDFGIAKIMRGDAGGDQTAKLTALGQTVGTLEYMSPEQLAGEPLDGRSDIYALGVMLYQMVTGKLPFVGPPPVIIHGHMNQLPAPPRSLVAEVPPSVEAIVLRCLGKHANERYADVVALRDDVRRAHAELTGEPISGMGASVAVMGAAPMGAGPASMGAGPAPMGAGPAPMGAGPAPMGATPGPAPMGASAASVGAGPAPMGASAAPMGANSASMAAPMGASAAPMGASAAPTATGAVAGRGAGPGGKSRTGLYIGVGAAAFAGIVALVIGIAVATKGDKDDPTGGAGGSGGSGGSDTAAAIADLAPLLRFASPDAAVVQVYYRKAFVAATGKSIPHVSPLTYSVLARASSPMSKIDRVLVTGTRAPVRLIFGYIGHNAMVFERVDADGMNRFFKAQNLGTSQQGGQTVYSFGSLSAAIVGDRLVGGPPAMVRRALTRYASKAPAGEFGAARVLGGGKTLLFSRFALGRLPLITLRLLMGGTSPVEATRAYSGLVALEGGKIGVRAALELGDEATAKAVATKLEQVGKQVSAGQQPRGCSLAQVLCFLTTKATISTDGRFVVGRTELDSAGFSELWSIARRAAGLEPGGRGGGGGGGGAGGGGAVVEPSP